MLTAKPQLSAGSRVKMRHSAGLGLHLTQLYTIKCYQDARRQKLLWARVVKNLVTTEGKNRYLDATLKTGFLSPLWYVGLVDNAAFTAILVGDTAAKINTTANPPTTNGWQELVAYAETTRRAWTPGAIAAAAVDNSLSPASFSANATKIIQGAFMTTTNVKGGTTGILLGAASFGTAQPVISGNVVDVVVACFFS